MINAPTAFQRQHCDFSGSEKLCLKMDEAGVPSDSKWRTLFLYLFGLQELDDITRLQKEKIKRLLTKCLEQQDFSERKFKEIIKEKEHILNAPYLEKLQEAIDESEKLLEEFQCLINKRKGDIQNLEVRTIDALEKGKEPKEIIRELRIAFHEVITVMEQDTAELERLSKTDQLTGLYNRRGFDEIIQKQVESAITAQKPLSLILLDIDHFKAFNDNYGHRVGDQALAAVAKIMKENIHDFKDKDNCQSFGARYGGEEFAIIMPELKLDSARQKAEIVRKKLESYNFIIRDKQGRVIHKDIKITVSIGVAELRKDKIEAAIETLIETADKGLYQAKSAGRNRVCVYQEKSEQNNSH